MFSYNGEKWPESKTDLPGGATGVKLQSVIAGMYFESDVKHFFSHSKK